MDPFERQFSGKRTINFQAIGAFVVGVVAAYLVHKVLGLQEYPPNTILTLLVICGVGGFWYHLRRIV